MSGVSLTIIIPKITIGMIINNAHGTVVATNQRKTQAILPIKTKASVEPSQIFVFMVCPMCLSMRGS